MQLSNYLFFSTQCEPALRFYEHCGFGRIMTLWRYGENGMPIANEAMRGKVLHSVFAGPGVRFYASDNDDVEPMRGSAMMFLLDDRERTDDLFAALSRGGDITTPLTMQPWGDYYGKVTDQFGVQWMFYCPVSGKLQEPSIDSA